MNLRLLQLNLRMSRLALSSWALGLFLYGTLSVFLVSDDRQTFLPQPYPGSFVLYLVIYALIFASGCLARRQSDNMLLTLGSLPINRRRIAIEKSAFFALSVVVLAAIGLVGSILGAGIVEADIDIAHLAILTAIGCLLVMAVFSYTLIAAVACANRSTALALVVLATLGAYLAETIGSGYEGLQWLARISIFHYYDPAMLLANGNPDWQGIGILVGLVIAGHAAALAVFARRDLTI